MKISERLRQIRMENGLTQTQLAKKLNLSMRTYQNYELGLTKLPAEELYKLILALDISADKFFERETNQADEELQKTIHAMQEELAWQHHALEELLRAKPDEKPCANHSDGVQ